MVWEKIYKKKIQAKRYLRRKSNNPINYLAMYFHLTYYQPPLLHRNLPLFLIFFYKQRKLSLHQPFLSLPNQQNCSKLFTSHSLRHPLWTDPVRVYTSLQSQNSILTLIFLTSLWHFTPLMTLSLHLLPVLLLWNDIIVFTSFLF